MKKDPSLLKVRNRQGLTTTLMAFGACDPSVIRYVLAHGGNAKDRTERGATAMHMAAMNGWDGALELAKSLGGDPNAKTASGRTPLMKAVSVGQSHGWTWLLAHGAKPDAMGPDGRSAALYAIQEGQAEALAALARAGADPKKRTPDGRGWLEIALENPIFLDTVAKYGVDVNARNPKTGLTPLMVAVANYGIESQAWLLMRSDPNLKDKLGRTAYDYARASNTLHTDRFLRALVAQYGRKR